MKPWLGGLLLSKWNTYLVKFKLSIYNEESRSFYNKLHYIWCDTLSFPHISKGACFIRCAWGKGRLLPLSVWSHSYIFKRWSC